MGVSVRSLISFWVAQVLGLTAITLVLIWTMTFRGGLSWKDEKLIFNIHPLLMLLGTIGQGGLAIMSLRGLRKERLKSYKIHIGCHAASLIAGLLGVCIAFTYHDVNDKDRANFYSLHSLIGIGVIVLYALQWIFSFLVFFYPGASLQFRRTVQPWHTVHGLFLYSFAVGNAALGFLERLTLLEYSGQDIKKSEATIVNVTALTTILFGGAVIFTAVGEKSKIENDDSYTAI